MDRLFDDTVGSPSDDVTDRGKDKQNEAGRLECCGYRRTANQPPGENRHEGQQTERSCVFLTHDESPVVPEEKAGRLTATDGRGAVSGV